MDSILKTFPNLNHSIKRHLWYQEAAGDGSWFVLTDNTYGCTLLLPEYQIVIDNNVLAIGTSLGTVLTSVTSVLPKLGPAMPHRLPAPRLSIVPAQTCPGDRRFKKKMEREENQSQMATVKAHLLLFSGCSATQGQRKTLLLNPRIVPTTDCRFLRPLQNTKAPGSLLTRPGRFPSSSPHLYASQRSSCHSQQGL